MHVFYWGGEVRIIYPNLMALFHRLIQFVFELKIPEGGN